MWAHMPRRQDPAFHRYSKPCSKPQLLETYPWLLILYSNMLSLLLAQHGGAISTDNGEEGKGGHPPTSAFSEIKVRYSDIAVFVCLERIGWKLVGGHKYSCLVTYSAVPATATSPARSVVGSPTPPKLG